MPCGVADGLGEAFPIAIVDAAIFEVAHYVLAELVEAVVLLENRLDADAVGIVLETVATGFVFDVGVDVGIVPKNRRLDTLRTEGVDAINAARSATGVHQQFHISIIAYFDRFAIIYYIWWVVGAIMLMPHLCKSPKMAVFGEWNPGK